MSRSTMSAQLFDGGAEVRISIEPEIFDHLCSAIGSRKADLISNLLRRRGDEEFRHIVLSLGLLMEYCRTFRKDYMLVSNSHSSSKSYRFNLSPLNSFPRACESCGKTGCSHCLSCYSVSWCIECTDMIHESHKPVCDLAQQLFDELSLDV